MSEMSYNVYDRSQRSVGRGIKRGANLFLYVKARYSYKFYEYGNYGRSFFGSFKYIGQSVESEKEEVGINIMPERKHDMLLNFLLGRRCIVIPLRDIEIPIYHDGTDMPIANVHFYNDTITHKYEVIRYRGGFKLAYAIVNKNNLLDKLRQWIYY